METVLSGMRPTGNLHLGNYYGAARSFVQMLLFFYCRLAFIDNPPQARGYSA